MKPYNIYKKNCVVYKLNKDETNELWGIIKSICCHKEFIRRCDKPYYHHDTVTLGEHIIKDTIVTYKLAKKNAKVNLRLACLIAMFHDLYEIPWQNVHDRKKLMNKHGFVHPIEAAINAITWYPEYFENDNDANIIIDGIIHHMNPLPVRAMNGTELNLNNIDKYNKLDTKYKKIIVESSKRCSIKKVGLSRSKYKEGRIVSKADKKVSLKMDLKKTSSYLRLIHGNNKNISNNTGEN